MHFAIFGSFDDTMGYGRGTLALAKAAQLAGMQYTCVPLVGSPVPTQEENRILVEGHYGLRSTEYDVVLAHCTPPQLRVAPRGAHQILYTMFERTALPTEEAHGFGGNWAEQIGAWAQEVFTPSDFVRRVIQKHTTKNIPVTQVDYLMQFDDIPTKPIGPRGTPFKVATFGDLSERKGIPLVIESFKRAFPDNSEVVLELKTQGDTAELEALADDPRIVIHTGNWSRAKIFNWLAGCDAFLWLPYGEGLSLPPMEAITLGLPTVVAANTGMLDWQNDNFFTVPCEEVPAPGFGTWFKADTDKAAYNLKFIYEHYGPACKMNEVSRQHLKQRYEKFKVSNNLAEVVRRSYDSRKVRWRW
jgi:glycosyltransferase involved in cell wall biosynthesis